MDIAFIDLQAQRREIAPLLEAAIRDVISGGQYIMGPQVAELERTLAEYVGVRYCLSCSSGTDALLLVLMAREIGVGDAVFVPSFSFVATAEPVALVGATPVFVDVDRDTFCMSPDSLVAAIEMAKSQNLNPAAVIPVDLFGMPADYNAIEPIASDAGLFLLADAAQGFGAQMSGRRVGGLADATTTSFFPAKPLGCYGDGGAVFVDDDDLYRTMRSLRVHGSGDHKYDNVRVGLNARLDTIQAAILLVKFGIFPQELKNRAKIAARYSSGLGSMVSVPTTPDSSQSSWSQYTIQTPRRDDIRAACAKAGIPTAIYYSVPIHQQTGYRGFPISPTGLPVTEALCDKVLSLPMHPYLGPEAQDKIIDVVRDVVMKDGSHGHQG